MIRCPKVLEMGPSGAGKTYSLRTLIERDITPFVWFTESMGSEVLEGIPCPKIHWRTITPGTVGWDTLIANAKNINALSNEALQKQPKVEAARYTQFIDLLTSMNKPVCERCGKEFEAPEKWGPDMAVVIDGLSGVSQMSRDLATGAKPVMTQPDWGVSMDNILRFILTCVNKINCWFILIAHIEPERDESTGAILQMPSTLGRKLAPQLPKLFSEVILARRDGNQFFWSTASSGVDTKSRSLPLSDKLPPDFGQLVTVWKNRQLAQSESK